MTALSVKVISAYKESTNSVIQVEKDARVALRTQAVVFGLRVRAHAIKLMESQKRKSLKLSDVVTGVAAQLAAEFPGLQVDNFIDAIFGSSVPYSVEKTTTGDKLLSYSTFTDEQTAHLFVNHDGHVQINHKNTLRVSEIERLLATTRKAHRTANAFLAVCVDQYVQNLLSSAEARVTHDKKKRVKVEHLQLPALTDDILAELTEFQKKKSDAETTVEEPTVDEPIVEELTVKKPIVEEPIVAPPLPPLPEELKCTYIPPPPPAEATATVVSEPPAKKTRTKKTA